MKKYNGGEAIASGGFGCVFRPPLTCNSRQSTIKSSLKNKSIVSKLMLNKYAYEEYDEVKDMLLLFKEIPKYKKYFILPEKICQPQKLNNDDLNNFDKKCSNLRKKNITSSNVNDKIGELKIIQMQEGGMDITKYIESN